MPAIDAADHVTGTVDTVDEDGATSVLPAVPHGICVNCGYDVTLRVVATEGTRRTYQWVPFDEPARPGRRCYEAAIPAYHWADGATAAVYHVST
ncbi:hypothetical protein C8K30_110180 [Promicromonospora sp. AC04]|uniref:hypothetical protein n=1 Tax=Promicromonospora sp. AC04 TaxID=2135723 RepID=UPI000D36A329|nr:hypothetical protein [Promicromonospora sp. AC04]PUB24036.1 hypothetical protein C8K30_110180 [Promicromonospora sp. AC04]